MQTKRSQFKKQTVDVKRLSFDLKSPESFGRSHEDGMLFEEWRVYVQPMMPKYSSRKYCISDIPGNRCSAAGIFIPKVLQKSTWKFRTRRFQLSPSTQRLPCGGDYKCKCKSPKFLSASQKPHQKDQLNTDAISNQVKLGCLVRSAARSESGEVK